MKRKRSILRGGALLLSAAATIVSGSCFGETIVDPKILSSKLDCPQPHGWSTLVESRPSFVVFGELHGTNQAPNFVGAIACSEAARDRRVLVALELSVIHDAALQDAWKLPPGAFDQALGKLGWAGRRDGVASRAMFALIVRLHALKELGLPISVAMYGGFRSKEQYDRLSALPGQGPYEAAMAENIRDAALRGKFDSVLILSGNFHAQTAEVRRGNAVFEPMAKRLRLYGKVASLDMRYGDGTSWNCRSKQVFVSDGSKANAGEMECGSSLTDGNAQFAGKPSISLSSGWQASDELEYSGTFWVGNISSSPPMFAAQTR